MTTVYIAAGSNLGDRLHYLDQARQALSAVPGVEFKRSAAIYETDPVGGPIQGKYLNTAWEIETSLTAEELLKTLLDIEKKLGRIRNELNGPRTIDLDILFFGDQVIDQPGLNIPHPRLHSRSFVLSPLLDLCPEKMHPTIQRSVHDLWQDIYA